jgi:hypothetical protein
MIFDDPEPNNNMIIRDDLWFKSDAKQRYIPFSAKTIPNRLIIIY